MGLLIIKIMLYCHCYPLLFIINFLFFRNYISEISALSHRIGSPHLDNERIVTALTNNSFFLKKDIIDMRIGAHPSNEKLLDEANSELVGKGFYIIKFKGTLII